MSCKRRRIVLVGVDKRMELNRAEFYEKELSFQVSCSYGPGRYDVADPEDHGVDYPFAFVRSTSNPQYRGGAATDGVGRLERYRFITKRIPHAERLRRPTSCCRAIRGQLWASCWITPRCNPSRSAGEVAG